MYIVRWMFLSSYSIYTLKWCLQLQQCYERPVQDLIHDKNYYAQLYVHVYVFAVVYSIIKPLMQN